MKKVGASYINNYYYFKLNSTSKDFSFGFKDKHVVLTFSLYSFLNGIYCLRKKKSVTALSTL